MPDQLLDEKCWQPGCERQAQISRRSPSISKRKAWSYYYYCFEHYSGRHLPTDAAKEAWPYLAITHEFRANPEPVEDKIVWRSIEHDPPDEDLPWDKVLVSDGRSVATMYWIVEDGHFSAHAEDGDDLRHEPVWWAEYPDVPDKKP